MGLWQKLVLVALGGSAGAVARLLVGEWAGQRWGAAFPWGTFIVNISGALLLGLLMGLSLGRLSLPPLYRLLLGTGFLGAYTTFSTLTYETWALVEAGAVWQPLLNVGGSILAGLLAVALGLYLGRAV